MYSFVRFKLEFELHRDELEMEVATAQRNMREVQSKMKIMEENKKCLESELTSTRREMIHMESSMREWKGNCEEYEMSSRKTNEDNERLRIELNDVNERYKSLGTKLDILEEQSRKSSSEAKLAIKERDRV